MATFAPVRPAFAPAPPQTIEDLGVSQALVLDLMLRRLSAGGLFHSGFSQRQAKLSVPIIDTVFRHMRQQQLVEIKGMIGNDYNFSLSGSGKQLASERFPGHPVCRGVSGVLEGLSRGDQNASGAGQHHAQSRCAKLSRT